MEIKTGVCLEYVANLKGQIRAMPSMTRKGLIFDEAVIDSEFRGEVVLRVRNESSVTVTFNKDRPAVQIVFVHGQQCEDARGTRPNLESMPGLDEGRTEAPNFANGRRRLRTRTVPKWLADTEPTDTDGEC